MTNIGGTTYTYDNNGNLTSDGTWTHTWDYRNRLTSSTDGVDTSSYEYDSNSQRIKLVEGADTTIYPSSSYKVEGTDITVDLNLGDTLVASDFNGTIEHIHTDHLGGTNITTDATGVLKQTTDYYPYGDMRIDTNTGINDVDHKYTGHEYDRATGLTYQGARYYMGGNGRFISQDPIALFEVAKVLSDPQQLNTYSYARNNPVRFHDPEGESIVDWAKGFGNAAKQSPQAFIQTAKFIGNTSVDAVAQFWSTDAQYRNEARGEMLAQNYVNLANQVKNLPNLSMEEYHYAMGELAFGVVLGVATDGIIKGKLPVANSTPKSFINASNSQLQKKFKHAGDFGVSGNYSKANVQNFRNALNDHKANQNTIKIEGTYRGNDVNFYYNSKNNLNVIESKSGDFVSGWKLNKSQAKNIKKQKSL